jgi:hypothetical protein
MYDIKKFIVKVKFFFAPTTANIISDLAKVEAKIELTIAKIDYEVDAAYCTMRVLEAHIAALNRELSANYKLLNQVNVVTQ